MNTNTSTNTNANIKEGDVTNVYSTQLQPALQCIGLSMQKSGGGNLSISLIVPPPYPTPLSHPSHTKNIETSTFFAKKIIGLL